ncbi:MAG: response regulator transcription factor [Gaiellales bacterium]
MSELAPQARAQAIVLIVDSALDDCVQLGMTLRRESLSVLTVATLAEARIVLQSIEPDVVVFDRLLPDGEGLELAAELAGTAAAPLLIALTDQAEEADRLLGFETGVDDYVAKPFSPQEVAYRIRAMLRRSLRVPRESHTPTIDAATEESASDSSASPTAPTPAAGAPSTTGPANDGPSLSKITIGALDVDPDLHEVRVEGRDVELTPVEFQILLQLARNPKLVLSRDQLIDGVWSASWNGDHHALDVHVSNLRQKLSTVPRDQTYIRAVRGIGFRLGSCVPDRETAAIERQLTRK